MNFFIAIPIPKELTDFMQTPVFWGIMAFTAVGSWIWYSIQEHFKANEGKPMRKPIVYNKNYVPRVTHSINGLKK